MPVMFGMIMVLLPQTARGQLGGLIKKKVADAVKPKEEPAPKELIADKDPYKFEISDASIAAFKRGLELEIKMRNDYRASAAKYKSAVEARKKCELSFATRPEAAKIGEEGSSRMDNAKTPAETQAAVKWMQDAMLELLTKLCGADPGPPPDQAKAFAKAQEAGAIEFGKVASRRPPSEKPSDDSARPQTECFEVEYASESGAAARATVLACGAESWSGNVGELQQSGFSSILVELFLRDYGMFKELVIRFCNLDKKSREDAVKNGVRVQGSNDTIWWIFTKEFAAETHPNCEVLMALIELLDNAGR
jgi:hypothetical protein